MQVRLAQQLPQTPFSLLIAELQTTGVQETSYAIHRDAEKMSASFVKEVKIYKFKSFLLKFSNFIAFGRQLSNWNFTETGLCISKARLYEKHVPTSVRAEEDLEPWIPTSSLIFNFNMSSIY